MDRIGIFARHPVAGLVKTRLSPALPALLAARLYEAMLADTLEATHAVAAERWLWWADEGAMDQSPGLVEQQQLGDDLGERLAFAMAEMRMHASDRAVLVGSDCPAVTGALLSTAFAALRQADVVLGPARDGGYWLVGARRPCPAIFAGIKWSGEDVLARTRKRAAAAGLSVHLLPMLADLDTPADVAALVGAIAGGAEHACGANVMAALSEMGLAR